MIPLRHTLVCNQRGVVLVMALMFLGLLSALMAAYSVTIRSDTALRGAAARERKAFYAVEAGVNQAMAKVKTDFDNYVPLNTSYTTSLPVTIDGQTRNVALTVQPAPGVTTNVQQRIATGKPYGGLDATVNSYIVTSTVTNGAGDTEAQVGSQFQLLSVPLFQFMAFSKNTLDWRNAPVMTVSGRIHTNGDLYLNTSSTTNIVDKLPDNPFVLVSASGTINRGSLTTSLTCAGHVWIDKLEDGPDAGTDFDTVELPCVGTGSSSVVDAAKRAPFLGALQAGVPQLQVPSDFTLVRGVGAGNGGIFWKKADLRIVLNTTASRILNFCGSATPTVGTGPDGLYAIEVQDAAGARDTTKTTALWNFMCERRGAIFYNDLPIGLAAVPAAGLADAPNTGINTTAANASNPAQYDPDFRNASAVYRRVGEDTNGDGAVDASGDAVIGSNDRNDDICPIAFGSSPIGARPSWRPDYCNTRFGQWTAGTGGNGNLCASLAAAQGAAADVPTTSTTSCQPPKTSWYLDNDYRRGGFYNHREQNWVLMLNVNIRALIDWNEANGSPLFAASDTTEGGLVFFLSVQAANSTTTPPAAGQRYAVRIFDSANLNTRGGTFVRPNGADPTGLSVASDQAVIIQGNYNYNSGMPANQKLPAAVLGDTIQILSQAWEVPVIINSSYILEPEKHYQNDSKTPYARATSRIIQLTDGYYVKQTANPGSLKCNGQRRFCRRDDTLNLSRVWRRLGKLSPVFRGLAARRNRTKF
jgi:hypothetical protein